MQGDSSLGICYIPATAAFYHSTWLRSAQIHPVVDTIGRYEHPTFEIDMQRDVLLNQATPTSSGNLHNLLMASIHSTSNLLDLVLCAPQNCSTSLGNHIYSIQ